KPSDSSANPYLALGAFVYAGLDGIRGKLDPGEAVNVDPATLTDAERAAGNTHRLPASLNAALDALAADEMLMDLLGPLRSSAYLAVKRSEAAHFAHSTDPYYECYGHRAARRRRIASRYKLAHTCTSRDQQDTALFLPNNPRITAGSGRVYSRDLRNQWGPGVPGSAS